MAFLHLLRVASILIFIQSFFSGHCWSQYQNAISSLNHANNKSRVQKTALHHAKTRDTKRAKSKLPSLIIFDLDGCLWSPEMYEILYFQGGQGSPFTKDDKDPAILRTKGGAPVKLLGNVRDVMYELQYDSKWWGTHIGISSRTDEPNWARELLEKFQIYNTAGDANNSEYTPFPMKQVFTMGICELAHDSKVQHFERIIQNAPGNLKFEDCLFFDNELGNCRQVAKLGVTVCYCPNGVTKEDWEVAIASFPKTNGKVIGK